MAENFANEYATTLNGAITDVATSLVVTSATGAPAANFRLRIDNEYLLVTAVAGTTFTVTRGVEGSTAVAHSNAATVTHVLTAGALDAKFAPYDAFMGPGLAATFVGSATSGGGLTITLTKPAGTADGDLVVFMVSGHNVIPNAAGPATGGGAWTERLRFDTDANEWIQVYTKIAASEGASWSITTNNASTTLSSAAVGVLRGPTTFVRSLYTDASLTSGAIHGRPNGHLIVCWLSALAAGTQFSISNPDITQHLTYRVASGEGAYLLASTPTMYSFPLQSYTASAAGIAVNWLGNLAMVFE